MHQLPLQLLFPLLRRANLADILTRSRQEEGAASFVPDKLILAVNVPNTAVGPDNPIFEGVRTYIFLDLFSGRQNQCAIVRVYHFQKVIGGCGIGFARDSENTVELIRPFGLVSAKVRDVAPHVSELL